jgi:tight adherence protein C
MTAVVALGAAALAAAAAVALAATGLSLPPSQRERMLRILAEFGGGRAATGPVQSAFGGRLRPPVVWLVQKAGDALTPPATRQRLAQKLDYAGNPPLWPVDRVVRARTVALIVFAVFGFVLFELLGLLGGAVFGLILPGMLVHNAGVKRQQELARSLPDVLDALVIGVEAGLGLDAALAQVAEMLRGPMPDEVRRVLQEMQLGVSRTVALRALAERTTVRDLKRLVTALVQAGELGISVAGILREHAAEQRLRRRQQAEEQAQKVAVKLLFPVLCCLFPVIFVVVLGPAVLNMVKGLG